MHVLDGDNRRPGSPATSRSGHATVRNIRRAAEVARMFNDAGAIVVVPIISPYRDDREHARAIIGAERFPRVT